VSDRFEQTTPPVTRTQIVRFAGAAGDFNPMHHDEPFAQAAGSETVFAMGQLQAGMLGSAVARWLGRDALTSYEVRYREKVVPGDVLVLRGEVVRTDEDGTRHAEVQALRERDGAVVLTGTATAAPAA
jgi:3-hydroxybutyryl-CoA dehydratase